ncbi:hypothetical protein [Halocatena marina]|uniref:hypothetical protein n=1 Tax=Halocatena marina TaxID=2934937 RepID=UPI00200D8081|nr:hypothetical protein [Halocatena marina]
MADDRGAVFFADIDNEYVQMIIVLSCYELSDFENGQYANEAILSTDGGASFDRILKVPLKTTDAANLHIHDVEYDPYVDRIWVVVGDSGNSQMYWSDDLGTSWETIADQDEVTMLTQIAAFKDCVAFGTDGEPEGINRWTNCYAYSEQNRWYF